MRQRGFSAIIIALLAALLLITGLVVFYKNKGSTRPGSSSSKENFVAIGASYTKANNLSSNLVGNHPEYSFATGTKIESLYLYLKGKGEKVEPRNLAESGADSQKVISQQLPNALSYNPKYVTIDIVADIFEEETPLKLKQNLAEIAKQIKTPNNVVLIGTYPNLVKIRTASFPACSEDKLGIGINKITEAKLKLFNQAIGEVANTYGLILVDNFDVLGPQEVSDYDCLHPNIEGQKKLAKNWIESFAKGR